MLKKIFCAVLLISLLSSCKPSPNVGADGYSFHEKQYTKNSVQVQVVVYKSQALFNKELAHRGLGNDVAAFTVLQAPFDTCTIHMIDPSVRYAPEFIGHEFTHCLYGQWHTNNSSKS